MPFVRFQILTAASMKMAVFWVVAAIALMMEAARTCEMSADVYKTTRRNNPEDIHLRNAICL
jgi:hypothetical protein